MGTTERVRVDGPRPAVIAVAVAIPLLAFAVVVLKPSNDHPVAAPSTTSTSATTSTTAISAYDASVQEAFAPLNTALPQLATAVSDWREGKLDDAEFGATLTRLERVFAGAQGAVGKLSAHPTEPLAKPLLLDATQLYTLAVRVHEQAVGQHDAALRSQLDLLGRRLRVLGDRAFDRSHDLTSPPVDAPGLDLRLPVEIPEWRSLGLAAGPPLTAVSPGSEQTPLLRVKDRPSQSRASWTAAVIALHVPTTAAVNAALDRADSSRLGSLADALVVAADALRVLAVPDGDHERADRLGVGWLVLADAARAGQLAARTGSDAMTMIARDLVEVATRAELS